VRDLEVGGLPHEIDETSWREMLTNISSGDGAWLRIASPIAPVLDAPTGRR